MRKSGRAICIPLVVLILAEASLRVAGHLYLARLYARQFYTAEFRPEDINIVCLGESSTAGLWVDWQDSYPKQLEEMLRRFYGTQWIRVIVPPHVGQNSSQVSNRIGAYLKLYKPKLIILMVGYNNEWSLAESHIGQFLASSNKDALKVKFLIALDGLRLFKVLRYGYLRFVARDKSNYMDQNRDYIWGHPELSRYPAEEWVYSFAKSNKRAFVEMWKYDVRQIIHKAKRINIKVLLMTYHINPTYLSDDEVVSLANEEDILLVRNDKSFQALMNKGTVSRYLLYDHWHPNRFGYTLIAYNAFQQIIQDDLLKLVRTRNTWRLQAPTELQQAEEFPSYPQDGRIDFGTPGVQIFLGDGWSWPEGFFRWTESSKAVILFGLDKISPGTLQMKMRPLTVPGKLEAQRVFIELNGQSIGNMVLRDPMPRVYPIALPMNALAHNNVLRFELPDARSPSELGISKDSRRLGIAMEWVRLEEAQAH